MKIRFIATWFCLMMVCSIRLAAQQTQKFTHNGYTLTFTSQDVALDTVLKERMVRTFFEVYPVLVQTYNPQAIQEVRFLVDTAYGGVAEASNGEVKYSSNWLRIHPEDIDVVTHEIMHLVQAYPGGPGWLTEGIADYVRYTYGVDLEGQQSFLPPYQADQHYTNSYRIIARFLLWVEKQVKSGIVKTLDKAMRNSTYSDKLWSQQTGKTLDQLWETYSHNPVINSSKSEGFTFANGTITDERVYQVMEQQSRALVNAKKTVSLATLASQLSKTQCKVNLARVHKQKQPGEFLYQSGKEGVLVVGTLYKCSHCPNDHLRAASGFVIAEDGVGVTNYHIFRGDATNELTDVALVVMDYAGNVYPITEVMAASKVNDIAIFKFNTQGKKFSPLPLGNRALTGESVNIISHPHSMFYTFTSGMVSRAYWREGGEKMSVTADFAQGSSGAPVLSEQGNVIGVVSATRSLYHQDQNVQMVIKETIPVSAIQSLLIQ